MDVVIAMSVVSVLACLVTLHRVVGMQRILRHATVVDVAFTLGLAVFLAGTLTGALVALLGGLIMAVTLTCLKRLQAVAEPLRKPVVAKPVIPAGADASEFDAMGRWAYNSAPYV